MIESTVLGIALLLYVIADLIEKSMMQQTIDELKETTDSLINDVQTLWDSTMNENVIECDFQPNTFSEGN